MKENTGEIPLACRLSDAEFRQREATLLAQFRASVVTEEEFADGYAFTVSRNDESIVTLEQLIAAERECCPFLTFELMKKLDSRLILRVTCPSGAKEFVRTVFCKSLNQG
jgi:hypothetical protein